MAPTSSRLSSTGKPAKNSVTWRGPNGYFLARKGERRRAEGMSPGTAALDRRGGRGEVRGCGTRCTCGVLHPGRCCPAGRLPRRCRARGAAGRRDGACRREAHSCWPGRLRAAWIIVPPDDHLRPPGTAPQVLHHKLAPRAMTYQLREDSIWRNHNVVAADASCSTSLALPRSGCSSMPHTEQYSQVSRW